MEKTHRSLKHRTQLNSTLDPGPGTQKCASVDSHTDTQTDGIGGIVAGSLVVAEVLATTVRMVPLYQAALHIVAKVDARESGAIGRVGGLGCETA